MRTKIKRLKISDVFLEYVEVVERIQEMEGLRDKLGLEIVRIYSPYHAGDWVNYRKNGDTYSKHGIIKKVHFKPNEGVEGLWELLIQPTDKKFKPYQKKYQFYLNNNHDRIIKINKKPS